MLLAQATVHEFITRGLFEPNLRRVNGLLKARRDAMLAGLDKHFSGATWSRPQGGYFIWLELPVGTVAKDVIQLCMNHGHLKRPAGNPAADAAAAKSDIELLHAISD